MPDPTKLSEENRAKLDGIVQKMISNNESEDNIKFVVEDFKSKYTEKKNPVVTSTSPNTKLVSAPKTGSSAGKATQGFPEIDQNGILPDFDKMKPSVENPINKEKRLRAELSNVKVTPENMDAISAKTDELSLLLKNKPKSTVEKDEVKSFGEGLINRLDTGIATISKSFYDMPSMIYDMGVEMTSPTLSAVSKATGKTPSEILSKELNIENVASKNMDKIIEENNKKIENYKKEIGGDVVSEFDKGNYSNTFKHAALNSIESVPLIAAAMLTGGESLLANLVIAGSSASTQYDQLNKEHPEMEIKTKLANSTINGALEVAVGKFMEGVSGNVWKSVLNQKGVNETAKIATNSFKRILEKFVEKSPVVGVAGEYAEERITDGLQQINDIANGVSTEFDWNRNKSAGLSSLGFSLPNATALYGSKAYIKASDYKKTKSVNKEIFGLNNELSNPNLSDPDKSLLSARIDRLTTENKKILDDNLEKANALPIPVKEELNTIDSGVEDLLSRKIDIQNNTDLSEEIKSTLIAEINQQGKELIARKNKVIDGHYIYDDFDKLPQEEKTKLKDEAGRSLLAEAQKEGKKSASFDDAELSKKAAELHNENLKKQDEAKVKEVTPIEDNNEVITPDAKKEIPNSNQIKNEVLISKINNKEWWRTAVNEDAVKERGLFLASSYEEAEFYGKPLDKPFKTEVKNPLIGDEKTILNTLGIKPIENITVEQQFELDKQMKQKAEELGYDSIALMSEKGFSKYKENGKIPKSIELNVFKNEATPDQNTPANGNIQSGASIVEQNKEFQANDGKDFQKAVEPTGSKSNAEINKKEVPLQEEAKPSASFDDMASFLKKNFIQPKTVKNETKPTTTATEQGTKADQGANEKSLGENNPTPKDAEREVKTLTLTADGTISKKGKTPLEKRRFRGDRKTATNIEPTDANGLALRYFIDGGQISKQAILDLYRGNKNEFSARTKIGGYAFEKVYDKKGNILTIDELANDIWERKDNVEANTSEIKDALENVINSHNRIADMVDSYLKSNNEEAKDNPADLQLEYEAKQEIQKELKVSDEEMQSAEDVFDHLTNEEIIRLADNNEMSYEDFVKDLKKREVIYDLGPFEGEKGIIQNDGYILSEKGELLTPESVSNVRLINETPNENNPPKSKENFKLNGQDVFYHASNSKRQGRLKTSTAPQFGTGVYFSTNKQLVIDEFGENVTEVVLKIEKPVYTNSKEWNDVIDLAIKKENEGKPTDEDGFIINEVTDYYEIKPTNISKAAKEIGYDAIIDEGSSQYENEIIVLDESKIQYAEDVINNNEKTLTKDQKKQVKNDAIDAFFNKVKKALPKAEGAEGADLQGIGQDQFIDMVADAVKAMVSAGIDINEAIKEVAQSIKDRFNYDIDEESVRNRLNPKKEENTQGENFKSKPGKKSLLNRLIEGGNPEEITKALEKLGTDYDVRNQKEVHEAAITFIEKVGIAEALKAVQEGKVKNLDLKMLIYDEAITRLKEEISNEVEKNPEDREALIEQFQRVSDEFDNEVRNAGQGISILNYIYNKNETLKYSLSKQIADYKRNSPDGKIPDDVKAKFEEIDAKLKDVEAKLKEAEKRAKTAEEELAVKNIQEDIERKKQLANKNKSGLTPKEQTRKKELRNKFFGRLNDATTLVTMLADPEFREYLGLTFKQAKGDFTNFSKKIIDELGKGAKEHLSQLFKEAEQSENVSGNKTITIGKDGKIKIPAQVLRDYVEAGETDINEISEKIKESIAEEYPDVDIRDIRDALTNYGKQINPNKDEITAKVNKLKEYGRLLSAYEDVMNGQMPKKSGLVREKVEQKSRELRKKINRLAKELELETIDPATQWATAIDKVKSNLKNQIEDLDQQIAKGEKRKVERTSITLDTEAEALKATRDALKQELDDLVGKPELTNEQKIIKAEKSITSSLEKLQQQIIDGELEYSKKPTPVNSRKLTALRELKKSFLETRKQLRQEAGLIEQQRIKTAKTRVKNQIEDLKQRIENRDFSKKEVKPILADNELNVLRAEKEALYEEYEKQKYIQELAERSTFKKYMDAFLEATALTRAIKASLDLGLIGFQLRGFTYSELWRNPKELGRKFVKLFGAIGSQQKTDKAMSLLIGHPLYALAKKLDIGITHPDLRNEVREEMASGNLLHVAWNFPMIAANMAGKTNFTEAKRKSIGDTFIDAFKNQVNKISKNHQLSINEKEKFSRAEQWKNINAFEAVERGLSTYGNQMRFEEFMRGVERLKKEGKDEINHPEDFKLLAEYIRTFSGRANPAGLKMNQKVLNNIFFSFKNMTSVFQQLNPIWYLYNHYRSSDFQNGNYTKVPVANKMAMATMFKSVASTAATMLFIIAGYNAFKDDDDDEMTIETDPRSSDFGKLKVGTLRYDPWGGYIPLITLYARLYKEEVKRDNGTVYKFGEDRNGIENRLEATGKFLKNKLSPSAQQGFQWGVSKEGIDKETGESIRVDKYNKPLMEDDAFSYWPIFLGSVKDAVEKDPNGVKSFLTAYSILGLGNVQDYESKTSKKSKHRKFNPEEGFPDFEPKGPREMD